MALTYSSMMDLGAPAPNFILPDTISGKTITLDSLKAAPATVIMFICNHCPFVHHINDKLVKIANTYNTKGVNFIAISSNDIENYPDDAPELMHDVAKTLKYPFPYLYDESQEVAKSYNAECTPDFFVFDKNLKCAYRGRFDNTRPNAGIPTGKDLTNALDCLLNNLQPTTNQHPSMGCGIKWK